MTDTHRTIAPRRFRFGSVTKMMVILVLVFLQQLFFPLVPAEARQLHSSVQASGPTVTIPQGTFTGTTVTPSGSRISIEAFLGIPYALPPTGPKRYSLPGDVGTSRATFDASKYGHICIQTGIQAAMTSCEDENCLFLNVFRPSETSQGKKLPVVVYIHGGSFVTGSGASRDIGSMVAAPKAAQIIGVSINYRLGALGFLSAGVTDKAVALNLGLRDQLHALKWIQANIATFGGDPTKVTIMGDSAGGHSVGHHLLSPLSAGYFHQAILESGAATGRFCQPYDSALNAQQFEAFVTAAGVNSSQSDGAVLSALRALPASKIKHASIEVYYSYYFSDRWAFQPVIDGPNGVIPGAPIELWNSGKWNKVPILTGFCNNEGAPFVPLIITTSQQFTDFFTTLNTAWGPNDIKRITSLYPDPLSNRNSTYPTEHSRIIAAYGQFAYIAPVRQTAKFASASGLPVFLYHVKLKESVFDSHACLGGYVAYDSDIVKISPSQKSLALSVNAFWVSFIATGDPNKDANNGVATWPRYARGSNIANKIVFGTGNDERVGGKNVGVLVQSEVETEFLAASQFWWSKTILSES